MKIAILGDTHFGARGNSERFHKLFRKFFEECFFPYLDANNITEVFQLGDLFDVRKNISTYTLHESKSYFFNRFRRGYGLKLTALVGNHDIYYRESLLVNTAEVVLSEEDLEIEIIKHPTTTTLFGGTDITLIPWICKENEQDVFEFINQFKTDLCFGHFEIEGFNMYKGMESKSGLSPSTFDKYELTLSGHYHTRSKKGQIVYVGTPYEITWQDHNDPRGFHIFDTETRQLEFIENPFTIFEKIYYRDTMEFDDFASLYEKIVKIIVTQKDDVKKFEKFLNNVYNSNPTEVTIVEDLSAFANSDVKEEVNIADTLSVINNYIDSVETTKDKNAIKDFMRTLYIEAQNMEIV